MAERSQTDLDTKPGAEFVRKEDTWSTVTESLATALSECRNKLQEEEKKCAVLEERLRHGFQFSLLATLAIAAGGFILEFAGNMVSNQDTRSTGFILGLVAFVLIFGPTILSIRTKRK